MTAYVYNVADVAYPVSIRDQMNRARWLVQKAHDLGFFGPKREAAYRRLLVCGAGAAGVTAAMQALNLGVETVLVERSAAPFLRQRLCTTRWLDPTQYDWSADFWTAGRSWAAGRFPYPQSPPMPLPWRADRSHRIALSWLSRWRVALADPRLTFRRFDWAVGTPTAETNAAGDVVGVRIKFHNGASNVFGMVLWCVGFGEERRFAQPDYSGFAFWESDPFERPHWGVAMPNPRAVVSGGGDGALQDVIRLATSKKSAADVFLKLEEDGWTIPTDVRHRLFSAEDQAQRVLVWCRPRSTDEHKALQRLHDAYEEAVTDLINADARDRVLISKVCQILEDNPGSVQLVHPCTHFGRVYGLNHFLVLLLARVAETEKLVGGPFIRQQLGVSQVTGQQPHVCAGDPWLCHGLDHDVLLEDRPLCHDRSPGAIVHREKAQVVVIRHGIDPQNAFAATPIAFARQVMPYHLP